MTRNTELLSEKELFEKTTSIVEHITNSKIVLRYHRGGNFCRYEKSKDSKKNTKKIFVIYLANPVIKHIPKYVALIHELGHILYESPFTPIQKALEKEKNFSFYFRIFNILEDQRIESQMSKYYLAYKKKFNNTCNLLGRSLDEQENTDDPIYILLAIRFMRDDLVQNSIHYVHYKKALNDVLLADKFGSLRVLISIKKYLQYYLKDRSFEPIQYISNGISKKQRGMIEKEELLKNKIWEHSSQELDIPQELLNEKYDNNEIKQILENGKLEGLEQSEIIHNNIVDGIFYDNTPSQIIKIKRNEKKYEINYKTAKKLNKIFKILKMNNRIFVDYYGIGVDVEEYVENLIRGINFNKSFENIKKDNGVSILISIDGSASMDGENITIARKLVATLFHSLHDISKVNIAGNVWSSNNNGDIGITEIKNISDVKQINVVDGFAQTPTHMGLEYSAKMLKSMKGNKKMLVLITDGLPNYSKNGTSFPLPAYIQKCKKSLHKVLRITPNVVCVFIGQREIYSDIPLYIKKSKNMTSNDRKINELLLNTNKLFQNLDEKDNQKRDSMSKLFGKNRMMYVENMQDASFHITGQFKKFIQNNMVSIS
jgi:hypothetical protein